MNIGIFTDSYRPYTSGVVRSIELFSREFNSRGHKVYIFGPDYPLLPSTKEDRVYRFASVPAPTFPEFSLAIPISAQLGQTIREIDLDIIHVQSPFLLGRLGARSARKHRLPLVFTFHTLYDQYVHYFPIAEKTSKQIIQRMGREFCNRCNAVIAPSRLVAGYLQRIGVETEIHTIPTGIDLDEFKDLNSSWLQDNHGVKPEEKVLLFVGRLGQEKNVSFLLKSFKKILSRQPQTRLVLVGKGPQEARLRKQCRQLGILDNVIFTGVLPRQKIVHCFASSHIFTFPSVTETQGIVIGEAMATGLPVVAIRAFGPAEMVSDGEDGFLTEPNLNAFTDAVLKLLADDELYKSMSARAKENVQNISLSRCADRMLDLYSDLIDRNVAAPRLWPYKNTGKGPVKTWLDPFKEDN